MYSPASQMNNPCPLLDFINWFTMAQKLDARGGKGGEEWDDGADHENIATIHVRGGSKGEGVQFIQVDYVKNGQVTRGPIHGSSGKGFTQPFAIDYQYNEYLETVEGYFDEATGVVRGLRFRTNLRPNSDLIGDDNGTKFTLGVPQNKIVGFHGFAGTNLNSLGVYVTKFPPIKLPYQGGCGGFAFDDGGDYDGVRKVRITYDCDFIRNVEIDYDKGGKVETRVHGRAVGTTKEFIVNYPNDYITSVEGTSANIGCGWGKFIVTSLTFKTSKGITSPTIGYNRGIKFVLESQGRAIVGFHGMIGGALDAIGVYCGAPPLPPLPPPPPPSSPSEKLQAKGGEGGAPWDDGVFDGVREIHVGQGLSGIVAVKFVYDKGSQEVVGGDHGKTTRLEYEKFKIQYPSEYLTEVQGCFDKIHGSEGGIITMLKFKTNLRVSDPYGLESTSTFVIGKEGHKIVGFHGSSSNELHQLGVHVAPISQ